MPKTLSHLHQKAFATWNCEGATILQDLCKQVAWSEIVAPFAHTVPHKFADFSIIAFTLLAQPQDGKVQSTVAFFGFDDFTQKSVAILLSL